MLLSELFVCREGEAPQNEQKGTGVGVVGGGYSAARKIESNRMRNIKRSHRRQQVPHAHAAVRDAALVRPRGRPVHVDEDVRRARAADGERMNWAVI